MVCNLRSQLPPHSETAGECSLWDEEVLRYNVIFHLGEFEGFSPHPHEPKGSLLKSALWRVASIHTELGFVSFGLPLPSVLKKDRATSGIFGSDPRNQQQIRGERKGTVNTV